MFQTITLEMSLKPFKRTDDEYIRKVIRRVFEQWGPLVKRAEAVSIMLWTADGSEILDYKGRLDEAFDWCHYVGGANPGIYAPNTALDPEGIGLHSRNYPYLPNPPVMTYGLLKKIVSEIKRIGADMLPGKKIEVWETFDPGPEFAKSGFKYERHNEICSGTNRSGIREWVCAYEKLHADRVKYAGFPEGIPEGTPFGTFFGRQSNLFLHDMGFDCLWLSNGVGFGRDTWSTVGATFDGEKFHTEKLGSIKKDVLDFWRLFRAECPDIPVATRGTNMSMGIDYATDAVPLKSIYEGGFHLLPPPNSPWAALDHDFGLELMGYMSRIAEIPEKQYMFRYYIHDPWWMNSPWYDRYGGQPHDIYLPMAVARIDETGAVAPPTNFNILSIDNTLGDMPDSCVYEPLPHILKAEKDAPDAPSPVVWVYPFREYNEAKTAQELSDMFSEDWFIRDAVACGAPISCVTSTDSFVLQDKSIYRHSILLSAVPQQDSGFEKEMLAYIKAGGRVVFYGRPEKGGEEFRRLINVKISGQSVSGELPVRVHGKGCGVVKHTFPSSSGAVNTELLDPEGAEKPFATFGGKVAGTYGKNVVWLRATVSADYVPGYPRLKRHSASRYFISETLLLEALRFLGLDIRFSSPSPDAERPVIMIARSDNAWMFSVFSPNTTVETAIDTEFGAPLLIGYETELRDGYAVYHFPKAEHRECRAFVKQKSGTVSCFEVPPVSMQYRRRIGVSGLRDATVRFYGEQYCKDRVNAVLNSDTDYFFASDPFDGEIRHDRYGCYYEARHVTGRMVFSMPRDIPAE